MAYYLDLFSPETYEVFSKSGQNITGFRKRQENKARQLVPGDKLLCYMTRMSRWFGLLEITASYFIDGTPIFYESNDPFVVRFKVKPTIWLPKNKAIPIREPEMWDKLSFVKGYDKAGSLWTGSLRCSLNTINNNDGKFIESMLSTQLESGKVYEFKDEDYRKYLTQRIKREDKVVSVSIPEDETPEPRVADLHEVRESYKMQALLAKIGETMGFNIWIPKRDRKGVLTEWTPKDGSLLEILPLNYDESTLKTIEQIDVIWLKRRSIVRAFEVEHTTSIYSGILRMADLLALQPNMDIKLHIVAPADRRDKVFQEIQRPVFSLLDKGPLSEICSYISYEGLKELSQQKHIASMIDSVLDDYSEEAE